MNALLLFLPLATGLLVLAACHRLFGRTMLVGTAIAHFALIVNAWVHPHEAFGNVFGGILARWLSLDGLGLYFLSIASLLFLVSAIYGAGYLEREAVKFKTGLWVETVFTACVLFFLFSMALIAFSRSFEILWVAVETTTLVSAPLIYFHRHQNSLEATWKYLMICSAGIALALLGTFFLSVSGASIGLAADANGTVEHLPLFFDRMLAHASELHPQWLKAAFIFMLIGYGTKMGMAPLHAWLPDAHSESPSMVSAMLSGALLNCAFLAILRGYQVCLGAGQAPFARSLLVAFGLLSIAFAAVFIIRQADYKRLLAYSSVEHMGILSLGVGLGGPAIFGGLLHAVNHSLTKGMLFLLSGNILAIFHSKSTRVVFGVRRVLPWTGALWFVGLFAITGSPPFGTFVSEFLILRGAFAQGQILVGVLYVALLAIVFIGMINIALHMLQGLSADTIRHRHGTEEWWSIVPPALLGSLVLILGIYLPPFLDHRLTEISQLLGGVK